MMYGLRYFENGGEVRLLQSSGGGRVYVAAENRKWWIDPKQLRDKNWEVYEATDGQTYDTAEQANEVAARLRR